MTSLAHLGENVGQLLALPLATDVCSQASLAELQRALVLADLQQLHAALFVRRVADDLADQVAHELGVLGLHLWKLLNKSKDLVSFMFPNIQIHLNGFVQN